VADAVQCFGGIPSVGSHQQLLALITGQVSASPNYPCHPSSSSNVSNAVAIGAKSVGSHCSANVILFGKRGTGMSGSVPVKELPTFEQRMDDVRADTPAVGV
jgi:hypothetical protein